MPWDIPGYGIRPLPAVVPQGWAENLSALTSALTRSVTRIERQAHA